LCQFILDTYTYMQEELKSLGLSYNEQIVYLSLLKLGETPVGNIIQDLKRIHRQSVYNALEALEERKMVIKKNKNRINHFQVANPEVILENIKKQELIAKRLSNSIKKELKKKKMEHEIVVFEGESQVRNSLMANLKRMPKKGTYYIISGSTQGFIDTIGSDFFIKKFEKARKQKNIMSKLVTGKNAKKEIDDFNKIADIKTRSDKYLPWDVINPTTTVIWDDRVAFHSYVPGNQFSIEIKNEILRASYLEHFNSLWGIAKK